MNIIFYRFTQILFILFLTKPTWAQCPNSANVDYGDCEMLIGWTWDGNDCILNPDAILPEVDFILYFGENGNYSLQINITMYNNVDSFEDCISPDPDNSCSYDQSMYPNCLCTIEQGDEGEWGIVTLENIESLCLDESHYNNCAGAQDEDDANNADWVCCDCNCVDFENMDCMANDEACIDNLDCEGDDDDYQDICTPFTIDDDILSLFFGCVR